MNKIKAIFANRKFSLDGLIEIIITIVAFVMLIVAIGGFGWLVSTYPAETGATVMCVSFVAIICCVLAGIFNTVFPKNDDNDLEVDEWIERAKNEAKKINEDDKLNAIREKEKKLESDLKQAEQDYMEEWAKKGITPEQMAWLNNWFDRLNKNISEGALWKRKDVVHESNR